MASLTDSNLLNVKVKTQPTNYGVNQISIGVADAYGNSSITATGYSNIIVTRGMDGYAEGVATTLTGITQFDPTGAYAPATWYTIYLKKPISLMSQSINMYIFDSSNNFSIVCTNQVYTSGNGAIVDLKQVITLSTTTTTVLVVTNGGEIVGSWKKNTNDALPSMSTVLGINANYHTFDAGYSAVSSSGIAATTTNPGKGKTGNQKLQGREAFYTAYLYDGSWRKITSIGQVFTKDYGWYTNKTAANYGTLTYDKKRSTLTTMLNSLAEFYLYRSSTSTAGGIASEYNQDLEDFLSLFAFYYDTLKTNVDLVFDYHNPRKIDHKLLSLFLQQLGVDPTQLSNPYMGRMILDNIVRLYQAKGSTTGVSLAMELFSGYTTTVSSTDKNMIPDINAASFIEGPNLSPYWTSDILNASTSPTLQRVSSPFQGSGGTYYTATTANGVMKVTAGSSASTPVIYGGIRNLITASSVTGTSVIPYTFGDPRINDFVIHTAEPSNIAVGSYIKSIDTTNRTVTLSCVSTGGTIATGTKLLLSSAGPNPDIISASSKMIPVQGNTRYAFSFYAHAAGYTATSITPVIYWYNSDGSLNAVSTSNSPTAGTTNTQWYRVTHYASTGSPAPSYETSPANAVWAVPGFTIGMGTSGSYFFDAFQFEQNSAPTTYQDPAVISITSTAYQTVLPYSTAALTSAEVVMKDYLVKGIAPINISTQSYTAYQITDVVAATSPSAMIMPNITTGTVGTNGTLSTAAYSMATVVIQTGTTNISVGQSFSLSPSICASGGHGLIVGVISSTQYRVVDRSWPGATVYTATSVSATAANIPNNMMVNVAVPVSITATAN